MKKRYISLLIDMIINRLSIARIIFNIDIKNIYYCFQIPKNNQWKIAFLIKYKPFGYVDSPYIDNFLMFLPKFFQNENTFGYITFFDIMPIKQKFILTIPKWRKSKSVHRIQSFLDLSLSITNLWKHG